MAKSSCRKLTSVLPPRSVKVTVTRVVCVRRAVGAHPGVGEGQALGRADLAIDADLGLHRAAVVGPDGHAPGAALAQVELAGQHGEAARHPPVPHAVGFDESAEHQLARRVQNALQREVADLGPPRVTCLCGHGSFPFAGAPGRPPGPAPGRPPAGRAAAPRTAGRPTPIPRPRAAAPPSSRHGRRCASRPRAIRPARSSTFRCLEIAGRVMSKGWASSPTVAFAQRQPRQNRPPRRVGEGGQRGAQAIGGNGHRWHFVNRSVK